jgi:hypothetical protein
MTHSTAPPYTWGHSSSSSSIASSSMASSNGRVQCHAIYIEMEQQLIN